MKVNYKDTLSILFGLIICVLVVLLIVKSNNWRKVELEYSDRLNAQKDEIEELKNTQVYNALMANVLNQVDRELSESAERTLSQSTIKRIENLSDSFVPDGFQYIDYDTLSRPEYSKERAFLLQALLTLKLDSSTFNQIKTTVSFAGADLESADLSAKDLSGMDLICANFENANMPGTNLQDCDLRGANFLGARADSSNMSLSKLNRVNFSWADLNDVDFTNSDMRGAILSHAKLRNADLSGAFARYSDFSQAIFSHAKLEKTILFGSDLSRSIFDHVDFRSADLREANISESRFQNSNLSQTLFRDTGVDNANWLSSLEQINVEGVEYLTKEYEMAKDPSGRFPYLIKITEQN